MSFSDEAVPAEDATPEPEHSGDRGDEKGGGSGHGGSSDEELAAELAAAAREVAAADVAAAGSGSGAGDDGGKGAAGVVTPDVFALSPTQQLETERDEYLLALQRTQADFENYRKRIARMQDEQSARAASDLVTKLLTVLDTLDLAEAHQREAGAASEDAKALRAARAMLLDTLAKEGLERVDVAEVPFDPEVHDAVAKTDGEGEPVIDEVLRSGYRWRGRVLRPAMVRVRG